jgi:hypothetical protein
LTSGECTWCLAGHEQRLERGQKASSHRAGTTGWSLRRIEEATGIRRETISGYLQAAGIPIRRRGGRPRVWPPKPATRAEVSTDLTAAPRPGRAPSASACEPYRELIERALERGRKAMAIWQDLVDTHGFDAVFECAAVCPDGAPDGAGATCRHHHGPRRRVTSRLWRRADGAAPSLR